MANWSKRTIISKSAGGGRYTKTVNNSGKKTTTNSYKVGSQRITNSIDSNGKQTQRVTTTAPGMGVKRQTTTLNKKTRSTKPRAHKSSRSKLFKPTRSRSRRYNSEPMTAAELEAFGKFFRVVFYIIVIFTGFYLFI
jgi:histidyl-tRNA synthetase